MGSGRRCGPERRSGRPRARRRTAGFAPGSGRLPGLVEPHRGQRRDGLDAAAAACRAGRRARTIGRRYFRLALGPPPSRRSAGWVSLEVRDVSLDEARAAAGFAVAVPLNVRLVKTTLAVDAPRRRAFVGLVLADERGNQVVLEESRVDSHRPPLHRPILREDADALAAVTRAAGLAARRHAAPARSL